jgi:hypothetical protein
LERAGLKRTSEPSGPVREKAFTTLEVTKTPSAARLPLNQQASIMDVIAIKADMG